MIKYNDTICDLIPFFPLAPCHNVNTSHTCTGSRVFQPKLFALCSRLEVIRALYYKKSLVKKYIRGLKVPIKESCKYYSY
jgi:hypothetical protein